MWDVLLVLVAVAVFMAILSYGRSQRKAGARRPSQSAGRDTVQDLLDRNAILFPKAVVGESHYQRNIGKVAKVGKPVQLVREPDNPHDKNAVRVDVDGLTIGYISRDDARRAVREEWKGIIAAVNSGKGTTGVVLGITHAGGDSAEAA